MVKPFCHKKGQNQNASKCPPFFPVHPSFLLFWYFFIFPAGKQLIQNLFCIKQEYAHQCKQCKKPYGNHKRIQSFYKSAAQMDVAHKNDCRVLHGPQRPISKIAKQYNIHYQKNKYRKPQCRKHCCNHLLTALSFRICRKKQHKKKRCKIAEHFKPTICHRWYRMHKKGAHICEIHIICRNHKHNQQWNK